jgi:hypothetical protein
MGETPSLEFGSEYIRGFFFYGAPQHSDITRPRNLRCGYDRIVISRIVQVFTLLSVLLFILTAAEMVRSFFTSDGIRCEEPGQDFTFGEYSFNRDGFVIVDDIGGVRFIDGVEDEGPVPTARRWSFIHRRAEKLWHDDTHSFLSKLGYHYDDGFVHGVQWTYPLCLCWSSPRCLQWGR